MASLAAGKLPMGSRRHTSNSTPALLGSPKPFSRICSPPSAARTRRGNAIIVAAAKGISLHIGVNSVDPSAYADYIIPELNACEFDANDMENIAKSQGMKSTKLLTKDASRDQVLSSLRAASKELVPGDLLFLTYSGHGGQIPDITGDEWQDASKDKLDETWCLYDGQLIDDELYYELSSFAAGVRILVLSDSCHSGTVTKAIMPAPGTPGAPPRPRILPPVLARKVYMQQKDFYDKLQLDVAAKIKARDSAAASDPEYLMHTRMAVSGRFADVASNTGAAVILISGCQDNQLSMDGNYNGLFTEHVLEVWNDGKFKGNIVKFHAEVKRRMPSSQTPNFYQLGPSAAFAKEKPFTV